MLQNTRLLWKLVIPILVVVVASLFTIGWYGQQEIRAYHHKEVRTRLERAARLFLTVTELSNRAVLSESDLQKVVAELDVRFTVIDEDGVVLYDSVVDAATMENHSDRREIIEALTGKKAEAQRMSATMEREMVYVALPLRDAAGEIRGVVRTSQSLRQIHGPLRGLLQALLVAGVLIALVAAVVTGIFVSRVVEPLERLQDGAALIADGDLEHRLPVRGSREIARLAEVVNMMVDKLADRLDTITLQRNELETVLSSMVEGVLVLDPDENNVRCNEAACRMLSLQPEGPFARQPVSTLDHLPELQEFLQDSATRQEALRYQLKLKSDLIVEAHGCRLVAHRGSSAGLVVMHDISALVRLEAVRRDFVANVSHELKTPVAIIQGFVETLEDGAYREEELARRFLGMIERQTRRLKSIIEDLLSLSRIELESDGGTLATERWPLKDVVDGAIQACQTLAADRGTKLLVNIHEEIVAEVNAPLLEQALINLLDNAIKYSPTKSTVQVVAHREGGWVSLEVKDEGPGIAPEHLPRLFERFYRVDKARSRKVGGTGLGLAIVKHIAQTHGGSAEVTSHVGSGSVFRLKLPVSRPSALGGGLADSSRETEPGNGEFG